MQSHPFFWFRITLDARLHDLVAWNGMAYSAKRRWAIRTDTSGSGSSRVCISAERMWHRRSCQPGSFNSLAYAAALYANTELRAEVRASSCSGHDQEPVGAAELDPMFRNRMVPKVDTSAFQIISQMP